MQDFRPVRDLLGLVLFVSFACGGESGSVPLTTQPSDAPTSLTSTPDPSASDEDFNACRTFREHFVESEWGLLDTDEAAEAAVGSRQASEVAVASEGASEAIASAGKRFLSTDIQGVGSGIDDMLVACAGVATP